jgi:formylglycine-generating enzyme required for sulfatase activity
MKKKIFLPLLIAAMTVTMNLQAQVRIGEDAAPASGALLDLKSLVKGGLLLPNVNIDDVKLIPTDFSDAFSDAERETNLLLTGTIVYNTNVYVGEGRGVYVWDGYKWDAICAEGKKDPPISPEDDPSPCGIIPAADGSATVFTAAVDENAELYEFFVGSESQGMQSTRVLTLASAPANGTVIAVKYYYPPAFLKPTMLPVSGGSFTMGALTQNETGSGTTPSVAVTATHKVNISSFYMSETEVTQAQFAHVMGFDPSMFRCGTLVSDENVTNYVVDRVTSASPVEQLNWYAAITYCNKLSKKEGRTPCYTVSGVTDWENLEWNSIPTSAIPDPNWSAATCDWTANGYRLPTEAEWEYAARGGMQSETNSGRNTKDFYFSGSNNACEVAWFDGNDYTAAICGPATNIYGTKPVKSKLPNALGLYGMSGNELEWCWDRCNAFSYDYNSGEVTDPRGTVNESNSIMRDGTFHFSAEECRVSYRRPVLHTVKSKNTGFRVAFIE